jgi:hypothetical protein
MAAVSFLSAAMLTIGVLSPCAWSNGAVVLRVLDLACNQPFWRREKQNKTT